MYMHSQQYKKSTKNIPVNQAWVMMSEFQQQNYYLLLTYLLLRIAKTFFFYSLPNTFCNFIICCLYYNVVDFAALPAIITLVLL